MVLQLEYEKALRHYHNSPAYLSYIAAKNKASHSIDENREAYDRNKNADRRIDIQPAEDEDGKRVLTSQRSARL